MRNAIQVCTVIVILVCLVGCSKSKLKEISVNDLCATHLETKQDICYGDERQDVEVIAGKGEEGLAGIIQYSDGLGVIYRYDRVVLIHLNEDSKDKYEAAFNIGDSKQSVMDRYGSENIFDTNEVNVNFFYDIHEKVYYNFFTYRYHSEERDRDILVLSTRLNLEDEVEVIMLADSYAITNLR